MTPRGCLSPQTAACLVRGEAEAGVREAAELHLRACRRCRERVDLLLRIASADPEDVHKAVSEVVAVTAALLAEPEHRWPLLAREAPYCRAEVAGRLLALALDERERDLRRAAQMALAAAKIADVFAATDAERAGLQFETWKTHSFLLREIGRFQECLAALARAEEAGERVRDPELARASIWHSRALILSEPEVWQPEEALALLDRAEEVYARRDPERWLRTITTRGMVHCRAGELESAKTLFEAVRAGTPRADEVAYADAQSRLAIVLLDVGDIAAAEELQEQVTRFDTSHGRTVNLAHDRAVEARIARARGEHERAAALAVEAMARFERLGMGDTAVRSGLTAVYSYVALEDHDRALLLCRTLVERSTALDQREPKRRRTLTATAITYLAELGRRQSLTLDVVAEVERYIDLIARQPCIPFRPPLPIEPM